MRHLMLTVFLAAMLAGCASSQATGDSSMGEAAPSNEQRVTRVSINANDVHEDCFEMKEGQTIVYSFSSDGPLRYNLHWHSASGMKNAAQDAGTQSAKGNFTAASDEYYCLMWNNQGQMPVDLRFSYTISK